MKNLCWLFLAILIAYGFAAVVPLPRYRLRGRVVAFVGWCFVPIILACPLLIPSAALGLRAASAFASGEITFKTVEYFRHWGNMERSMVLAITTASSPSRSRGNSPPSIPITSGGCCVRRAPGRRLCVSSVGSSVSSSPSRPSELYPGSAWSDRTLR